jgi:hypothetical protein
MPEDGDEQSGAGRPAVRVRGRRNSVRVRLGIQSVGERLFSFEEVAV